MGLGPKRGNYVFQKGSPKWALMKSETNFSFPLRNAQFFNYLGKWREVQKFKKLTIKEAAVEVPLLLVIVVHRVHDLVVARL